MLKWAVNAPRQSYLQSAEQLNNMPERLPTQAQRRRLKRKSSDACMMRPKNSWHDKENQFTSTPLPASSRSFSESPSRKLDSLKDLSNIVADFATFSSPKRLNATKTPSSDNTTPEARGSNNRSSRKPATYASTLPTFDVEYSPCALIPGPLLALRGVGIPDSYFEKPRYLTPHPQQLAPSPTAQEDCLETKTFVKPQNLTLRYPAYMEESSLSSSKMSDTTLERMIDAILESTHKERKQQKQREKYNGTASNMSPTYTPADDPASDLHEVWDSEKARYRQKEQKYRAKLTKKCLFNEREVCSPLTKSELDPGQLRRQGGVRRKRKLTQITASVMNSAQKLLGKSTTQQTPLLHSHNLRKVFEAELIHDEVHPQKLLRNVSPDSGHNSSSEYEEEQDSETTLMDVTKRRLSFSLPPLNER